jgi:hypothetical protein
MLLEALMPQAQQEMVGMAFLLLLQGLPLLVLAVVVVEQGQIQQVFRQVLVALVAVVLAQIAPQLLPLER